MFSEFLTFWGKQAADGRCSDPETWFNSDGSSGMTIIRDKSDALRETGESEEYERLLDKGQLIVGDLKTHLWFGGSDEEIQRSTGVFAQTAGEFGYM